MDALGVKVVAPTWVVTLLPLLNHTMPIDVEVSQVTIKLGHASFGDALMVAKDQTLSPSTNAKRDSDQEQIFSNYLKVEHPFAQVASYFAFSDSMPP